MSQHHTWQGPSAVWLGGGAGVRGALAYLEGERVRVLYDVHTGKPDHKHIDGVELPYAFVSLQQLAKDFFQDIEKLSR